MKFMSVGFTTGCAENSRHTFQPFSAELLVAALTWLLGLPCLALSAPLTLPSGIPQLPELQTPDQSGLLISKENIEAFERLVVDELRPLVRSGEFVFEGAVTVAGQQILSAEWIRNSSHSLANDESTSMTWDRDKYPPKGFLFSPERFNTASQTLGQRLLWNATAHLWSRRLIRAEYSLFLLRQSFRPRKLGVSVDRVYPERLGKGKAPQVFREKIVITSPAIVAGYTWLTFRFAGEEEDAMWILSPAIAKARELTGTNRGDNLFSGAFAPDDLFVTSGKPEIAEVTSVRRETLFVPFLREMKRSMSATRETECSSSGVLNPPAGRWNFETEKFKGAAGWVPTDVVFVPRNVFRIEYSLKDPFALSAHEIVYMDEEYGVPFFKVSVSRLGETRKMVLGAIGGLERSIEENKEGDVFPIVASLVVISSTGEKAFLALTKFDECSTSIDSARLESFDPAALKMALPTPVPSATAQSVKAAKAPTISAAVVEADQDAID